MPDETLRALNAALLARPEGFTPERQAGAPAAAARATRWTRRRTASTGRTPRRWPSPRSWPTGTPIRLTGQDTERGTFSQRHLVLHDAETGARYTPLAALPQARASFAVYNSPLSEAAALGFEYGYSVQAPDALVLWEAQFGDFANGAQVIIDQFIAAARAKWGQHPVAGAAAAARLRGPGAGALQRPARALPAARRRGQPAHRQLHDRRAVLPPAARAGARCWATTRAR